MRMADRIARTHPEAEWRPLRSGTLQRSSRGERGSSGACADCRKKRLQPQLRVGSAHDPLEREADRVADAVVLGGGAESMRVGDARTLRREEGAGGGAKPEAEKYKEAAKKVGEAFLETGVGKQIVGEAKKLGEAFWGTLPGKIITGTAAAGAVTTIAATNSELPIQVPEIPLDVITPGLSVKLTYEGPAQQPTNASIAFIFKEGKKEEAKKPAQTESEKYRAETAKLAQEQAAFREGLKSKEQRATEKAEFWDAYWQMRASDPLNPLNITGLRRATPGERKKQEEPPLTRKETGSDAGYDHAPPLVDAVLGSGGTPLDGHTRAFMERRFGHRFADVRVHTDARASASAQAVGARAYAVGRDVVFGAGAYAPQSAAGQRLLAHELTHVVQQAGGSNHVQRTTGHGCDPLNVARMRSSRRGAPASPSCASPGTT